MAKVKKRKVAKGQDGWLENLLRFEIVVVLFALIGFYYFLSFSPIRMPKEPIASPRVSLAPLPSASEPAVPVQENGVRQVDHTGLSGSTTEVASQRAKELESGSRLDEITVVPVGAAVTEAQPSDKTDDKSPVPVGSQKVVSSKAIKSQSVESPAPSLLPSTEPVSVPARALSSSAPLAVVKVVEVGSYVLQVNLQRSRSQLEALGLVVKTETRKCPTPMSRVFLGPYSDRQEAQKMMVVAREMGDQPFLQKQDTGYIVVIGSFYLEASVVAWENMYQAAGLDPKVRKESLLMPHTLLLLDGPRVALDPEAVLARVRAAGFPQARLRTTLPTSAK